MPGSITVTGGSTSVQFGQRALAPFTIVGPNDISETISTPLSQGSNVFFPPEGSVGVIIVPFGNEPSTTTWNLRTNLNATDTGLPIIVKQPFVYAFPAPAPTCINIIANAAQSDPIALWFW